MSDEIADLTGHVLGGLMAYQASMPTYSCHSLDADGHVVCHDACIALELRSS